MQSLYFYCVNHFNSSDFKVNLEFFELYNVLQMFKIQRLQVVEEWAFPWGSFSLWEVALH